MKTKAPGQHAQVVERRGAILRHSMHCVEEQLTKEGVTITFKQLLAESVFSGNALITHNGASPYNARMGTQPAMLPELAALPDTTTTGPARFAHRIREVSLQKIIESTALGRINRAMRIHTTLGVCIPALLVKPLRPAQTSPNLQFQKCLPWAPPDLAIFPWAPPRFSNFLGRPPFRFSNFLGSLVGFL